MSFFTKGKKGFATKIIVVFIMTLLLQIPIFFVRDIIQDRGRNYSEASRNIGNDWGKYQVLTGPYLAVSKEIKIKDEVKNETILILPDQLNININLKSENKSYGIYSTLVYLANGKLKGSFDINKIPKDYKDIYLGVGLRDTKALVSINKLKIKNLESIKIEPGTKSNGIIHNGFSTQNLKSIFSDKINNQQLLEDDKIDFDIELDFRGHGGILIHPFGEQNDINIKSNWSSPSYKGILPVSKKNIDNGFDANWKISSLVRNYPQVIETNKMSGNFDSADDYFYDTNYDERAVNVKLLDSVNYYTQINRATNYGMLFIILSLMVVYIFDLAKNKKTHYLQYGIIGFSLVLFYLLLLSLSEYIGFTNAYIVSTLAIAIPNGLYMWSISNSKKIGISIGIFLGAIYAMLFSILKMEKYALLCGTILIMFILYLTMYLTKNDNRSEDEVKNIDNS
ncbi:cell envelope integrity protein CreD [Campylobacter sp. FMV-PI01]|uniref:Cell envelope integrity protein CreD n=1 Tax=Campylobacter portucalensis TaxID=2608384 RepID=A0A6L5WFZ8_9BACT|nr:cell envelope integrity protein CreD [Campylobacter portucalensis]MSN96050.1 cell envelope integrity protein CreD [Campylobacter portucalensis]